MSIQDRLRFWKTHLPSETLPKSLLPDEPTDTFIHDAERSAHPEDLSNTPSEPAAKSPGKPAEKPPAYFDAPLDRALIRQVIRSRRPFVPTLPQRLETHWYECLLYPFRAWPLVFGLSGAMALCTGIIAVVISQNVAFNSPRRWIVFLDAFWAIIPLPVMSYLFGFLDCVMAGALAGEFRHVRWPGRKIGLAFRSCFTWATCFLAGPIVPIALALIFWLQAGEMQIIDWLILGELVIVAFAYWILVLLTVHAKDGLRNSNPLQVTLMVGQLGWKSIGIALGAAGVALVHVLIAIAALTDLQRDKSWGWFALILCSWSGMFWATFLFRWLGIWCRWLDRNPSTNPHLAAGLAPREKK
jgi:hypothetical protein